MKHILNSLVNPSFIFFPILFFLWALADEFSYHATKNWFHDYVFTVTFYLPFIAVTIYAIFKFATDNKVLWLQRTCIAVWVFGLIATLLLLTISH